MTSPLFTAPSDRQDLDNQIVLSRLTGGFRVTEFAEWGISRPVIIANGCPIDFTTFNMMIAYFATGNDYSVTDVTEASLARFWERIAYMVPNDSEATRKGDWSTPRKAYDRDYFYALDCVMRAMGIEKGLDGRHDGTDILPAMKEVSAMLEELRGR